MTGIPATPLSKLSEARQIALSAGLLYVYTGNVHDLSGSTTYCGKCKRSLIVRDWYLIREYFVTDAGECPFCGTKLTGRFGKYKKQFGRQRIPVQIGRT